MAAAALVLQPTNIRHNGGQIILELRRVSTACAIGSHRQSGRQTLPSGSKSSSGVQIVQGL